LDITFLLKQKKEEEEALDRANAELVQKISAEVALSEREFDKQVAELEAQGMSATDAIAKISQTSPTSDDGDRDLDGDRDGGKDSVVSPTDDTTSEENSGEEETTTPLRDNNGEEETTSPREKNGEEETRVNNSVLIGVDEGLFTHEAEEELPEFSDDDDD